MSKKKKFALLDEDSTENLTEELLTINITRSPSYDNADKLDPEQLGKRSQKKCKRCREYYYEEENQNVVCKSHPGIFTEPSLTKGTHIGWSCCRPKDLTKMPVWKDLYKEGAYVKTSPGCFTTNQHIEDLAYTDRVMRFPVYNENVVAPKREPEGKVVEKRDGPIVHKVLAGDTLAGLSLKYNISTDSIKRVNKINSPQLFQKELIIPHSNDSQVLEAIIKENQQKAAEANERVLKKGQMVVIFKNETKSTSEEAKFYLEQSDYNLEEAIKEWRQDEEHFKNKKN